MGGAWESDSSRAEVLEQLRPKLLGLAYRMLGSAADAEDAVQDAYLRFQQADAAAEGIASPDAWLVKATTRLCIDRLRQAKRREAYVGPWLPEPVAETWPGAGQDRLELAESLSMAFLVLLESLSPAERAAYLLREVFNYEFDEIATLLHKTPVNVRQITARAKKRLAQKERRPAGQATSKRSSRSLPPRRRSTPTVAESPTPRPGRSPTRTGSPICWRSSSASVSATASSGRPW